MARFRIFAGSVVELDNVPGLEDPTGDQPAQLEGMTTKNFLHLIDADAHTVIQIDMADPEVDDVWHPIAVKRGLGGWE